MTKAYSRINSVVTVPTYLATEILFGRAEVVAEEGGREGGRDGGGRCHRHVPFNSRKHRPSKEREMASCVGREREPYLDSQCGVGTEGFLRWLDCWLILVENHTTVRTIQDLSCPEGLLDLQP